MTKWGMRPGVAHNPDPTFAQAEAHITAKARRKAARVVYVMTRVAQLAKFQVVGVIALKDENGNVFPIENGGEVMTTDGRLSMDEIEETLKKCRKQIFYIESLARLRAEIEEQMGSVKGTDYSKPRVSSSNISDLGAKVEAAWDKLQVLDEKVAAALETQAALRLDALDLIERCDNAVQMAVLSWYYIHGYSWEAVARKINYEDKYVFRIRNAGLEAIERNARATIK